MILQVPVVNVPIPWIPFGLAYMKLPSSRRFVLSQDVEAAGVMWLEAWTQQKALKKVISIAQRIHGTGIFTYIYHKHI